MVYSIESSSFRLDKIQFFNQVNSINEIDSRISMADGRVGAIDYSFLLKHHATLEIEFKELFKILQAQENENKEAFWLYCYYCASLLEVFYRSYWQTSKEEQYKELKAKILQRLKGEMVEKQEDEQSFIESIYSSFIGSLKNLITSPFHISRIRDYVAFANVCRLYWAFCRLTITQGLLLARDLHWIEKLDVILGTHTDVDKIISAFRAPIGVMNFFSVGFFLTRFMIDGGLLLKHTLLPSELEKGKGGVVYSTDKLPVDKEIEQYRRSYILVTHDDISNLYYVPKSGIPLLVPVKEGKNLSALISRFKDLKEANLTAAEINEIVTANTGHVPEETTAWERFKYELYKRHCNFANDLVWATVNFLTNYNHITQIPGPIAGYITSAFLVFDVAMALYKCNLAKQEYLTKKAQYIQEIEAYNNPELHQQLSDAQRLMHIDMLNQQKTELEISWHTTESKFHFIAAAAAMLMMGFTASMVLSPPVLVLGSFFVCTVAIAMYLSTDDYSQYKEKSLYLEQAQLTGKNLEVAQKEYDIARNQFFFTMTKNTIMPMVLITTYAICWPAALALTAMYLGNELLHAYQQHRDTNEVKQLAFSM